MLRAHYRETPKLQAGTSKKGKDNGSKEGRREGKGRKEIPKNENFPKPGIFKQHSRDCHIECSTIVLSQNTLLGLAEYELLRNSYAILNTPSYSISHRHKNIRQECLLNVRQESLML